MKFKSIFHKLLVYYISTALIGLGLLAFIINYGLQELLFENKASMLYDQADQIIELLAQNDEPLLESTITYNKRISNIKMDLLLINENDQPRKINKQKNKLLKKSELSDPKLLDQVLTGVRITHVGPFKTASDEMLLTVGVPIQEQDKITGALFLHTPVQEVPTSEVSKLILIVSLVIAIPASLILYWISRKISKPLEQMNDAANSIGVGNFKERIKVESQDEVGQLAMTFNQMAAQLERLETMRKELIINVSHELRTPLTSVRGFIQGMMEGVIPPNQHERYLEICYRELNRLSTLLNTMLDLSAIESGRITLQPVVIRLESLISSVANSVTVRMEAKKISFHTDPSNDEPLKVYGDPERVKQVLFNLLDNAIRHTPEGGTISIYAKMVNHEIEIKLSDNGSGIDSEKLPHIWERFYTEDPSRMSHRERSGLGLTITKQLVELMGGRIAVDSTVGKGTTFTLHFPQSPL